MKLPREFHIPKGAVKIADKQSDAIAYIYSNGAGKPCARVFFGKQNKPVLACYYMSTEQRDKAVSIAFESRRTRLGSKAEQRAQAKAFVNPYKVGDLFRRSWGYDQTNIDWYEVVAVSGKMVTVREIEQATVATGDMCGRTTPQPGMYRKSDPKKCRAQDGRIKINHYAHAYFVKPEIKGGVPVYGTDYFSTYA